MALLELVDKMELVDKKLLELVDKKELELVDKRVVLLELVSKTIWKKRMRDTNIL